MSTSGNYSINGKRDVIVKRSLRMVGAYSSTGSPRAEQLRDAIVSLNLMIKSWQMEGFLWTKAFAELTLIAAKRNYSLGSGGDTCVYQGTAVGIQRPMRVYSGTLLQSSGTEIPLVLIAQEDYLAIPNKTSVGKTTQIYYQPTLPLGTLFVWPVPNTGTTDKLVLLVDRPLCSMDSDTDDFDFPDEWLDTLAYGLAARIAPEYGLPIAERQLLQSEAISMREAHIGFDRDEASTFFQVGAY
jgi:hypothetical protein